MVVYNAHTPRPRAQGRVPWNKGKKMSEETKQKIRDSKKSLGRPPRKHCALPGCYEPTRQQQGIAEATGYLYSQVCSMEHGAELNRFRKWGITTEEFNEMLVRQEHRCAICGKKLPRYSGKQKGHNSVHIDHDHNTGRIRGLLCGRCNIGLGYYDDDPERLRIAADYLERNSNE